MPHIKEATFNDTVFAMEQAARLIEDIQDALGTKEIGKALVEVARNAHKAEQELSDWIANNPGKENTCCV